MRWLYHVARGVRTIGEHGFAPGIPVCFDVCVFGLLARGPASDQPGFELRVPAFRVCTSSIFNVRPPWDAVSKHCHRDFLY